MDSLYLAWRYIVFNRIKTLTLITCITLICFLPLALKTLLSVSEQQLLARAAATELLVGAKGNPLDLAMNSLYFSNEQPDLITMQASERVYNSSLALPIPLYVRFQAREHPIVGTSVDYFDFRGLTLASGRHFAMLGECVIGADVAKKLNLNIGDKLLSSPKTLFDLGGIYPLQMTVTGVLKKSHSADDNAVFVDLKTTWVIEGLGHGHQDVEKITDKQSILSNKEKLVTASAKIKQYAEITTKNLESFHFHGDPSVYPISAVIAAPIDAKSATILMGRYLGKKERQQIIRPQSVIQELLNNIFQIKDFIDAIIWIVSGAMILALLLVFNLSFRLRQKEIDAIFHFGCNRLTIFQLMASEILIITLFSGILCGLGLLLLQQYQTVIFNFLFIK